MLDQLLNHFADLCNTKGTGITIWVAVPGSIIMGSTITPQKYAQFLLDNAVMIGHDEMGKVAWTTTVKELLEQNPPKKEEVPSDLRSMMYEYIHLKDVQISFGCQIVTLPVARIYLPSISCWGFGNLVKAN